MLKISNVTASGSEGGHDPSNAIDNNPNTRWHSEIPAWLQADLGSIFTINEVDISWYEGDKRTSDFEITTSTDNTSFKSVYSGKSSGTTTQFERYTLTGTPAARYVRISVTASSNKNKWASITELQIQGGGSPPPPPGPVTPPTPTPIPIPSTGTRQQIRQTTTGGDPVPDADWKIVADTGPLLVIQPPGIMTVQNETLSVLENTPLQIVLSATDTNANATITFENTQPSNGKVTTGTQKVAANQLSLVYTPNQGFAGTDSFLYSATDDKGASSNSGTVTIAVSGTSPTPTPTPTPSSQVDQFGIQKIYADGPGPVTYMDMSNPSQTRGASPGNNPEGSTEYYPVFVKNSDGSWKNTNGKEVRWAWCAEDNYPGDNNICKCYDTNNKTGNMGNPGDWPPRVEMTGYYRSNSGSTTSSTQNGETHIEHVISGHRSTTSSSASGPGGCELGCAGSYHCNKYPLTGRQKFEKDYHHSFAYAKDISGVNNTSATPKWANDGQWHGFKDIFYILPDGKTVQLESWTDWNADQNWKKTHSFQDDGIKWVPKASYSGCGNGSPTIAFLFNGPLVDFRADNWNEYDIKWCSIRSIDPTQKLGDRREHEKTFPEEDFVEDNDVVYQEQKWHKDDTRNDDNDNNKKEPKKIIEANKKEEPITLSNSNTSVSVKSKEGLKIETATQNDSNNNNNNKKIRNSKK